MSKQTAVAQPEKEDKLLEILEYIRCSPDDCDLNSIAAQIRGLVQAEYHDKEAQEENKRISDSIRSYWKNRQNLAE